MRRSCSRIAVLGPVTLAALTLVATAPRAGLVFHHHAGGEHSHYHLDPEQDHAPQTTAGHHHHHDHAGAHGDHAEHAIHEHHHVPASQDHSHDAAIEGDRDATGHWHVQSPFHRVGIATAFVAVLAHRAESLRTAMVVRIGEALLLPHQARAPPVRATV